MTLMFVQDFEVIDEPLHVVVSALEDNTEELILGALNDVRVRGEHVLAKVKPDSWPALLSKTVEVRVGDPRIHRDCVLIPFRWTVAGGMALFPALEADVELAPFGDGQTEVTIRGNYEPPGGALGRQLDQVLLHRIATSTVRAVLRSLCETLTDHAVATRSASQAEA